MSSTLKRQRIIFLVFLLLFAFPALRAQDEWKLKVDKEGIKIYTSPYADSKIKALKVICTVESTLSQLTAVLLDIKCQDEWFYHTKSTVLQEVSPFELYYYSELYLPFPFSNRDFVEHIKLTQNSVSKVITMIVQNDPNFISPKKGIVRVLQSQCKWIVTPVSKNLNLVEFTLYADPAGSIPLWLVNMMSFYAPFETFKKLKTQLKKPEYQNVLLAFVKNY
jgi:hypothetical protein